VYGRRPDVDPGSPDLPVNLHLSNNHCTVSLDLAGEGLHRRGYRLERTAAPLRETLAAGLVLLSGWDGMTPFVDPMCGSGTLPIEAALIATRTAPGAGAQLRLPEVARIRGPQLAGAARRGPSTAPTGRRTNRRCRPRPARPQGRPGKCRKAAERRRDHLEPCRLCRLAPPPGPGTLLVNPPMASGCLAGRNSQPFTAPSRYLQAALDGWTAWLFTGNLTAAKRIGLKATRRIPVERPPRMPPAQIRALLTAIPRMLVPTS